MKQIPYDREKALNYCAQWAHKRNKKYQDFSTMGGDCTNFISQCLYAGSGVMNTTPNYGWYYRSAKDRAPAWTGVEPLYRFLTNNRGKGPFATACTIEQAVPGDIIQLGDENSHFYHSLFISDIDGIPSPERIFISTHTFDAHMRQLSSYNFANIRFLHIEGIRH